MLSIRSTTGLGSFVIRLAIRRVLTPSPHPIKQSANIGIGYEGVFGQNKDWAAIVATWAEPTDCTLRDQYGLEFDYSFRLFPNIIITPHVQLIRNPSKNPTKDSLTVFGLRARFEF